MLEGEFAIMLYMYASLHWMSTWCLFS